MEGWETRSRPIEGLSQATGQIGVTKATEKARTPIGTSGSHQKKNDVGTDLSGVMAHGRIAKCKHGPSAAGHTRMNAEKMPHMP